MYVHSYAALSLLFTKFQLIYANPDLELMKYAQASTAHYMCVSLYYKA